MLFGAALLGCAAERGQRRQRPSLLSSVPVSPAYPSPGVWRYHPREPAAFRAELALPGGGTLYAGARGERWLHEGKRFSTAAMLAPEDLVGVQLAPDSGFLFVGTSGTTYESATPLGDFTRASAPLERLVRVAAGPSGIVGIGADGGLRRSADGGASWERVGPAETRFFDVAVGAGTHALALAVPEALWFSDDAGRTWQTAPPAPVGARAVQRAADGRLTVAGVFGPHAWAPAERRLAPGPPAERGAGARPIPDATRGPDAGALAEGRAIFIGHRYAELEEIPKSGGYQLWSGELEQPLTARPLGITKGCERVWLAAFEERWFIACSRNPSTAAVPVPVQIYASFDDGKTWERERLRLRAKLSELQLAAGADGALLVTGACLPERATCSTAGILQTSLASARSLATASFATAAVPGLKGSASGLAFSIDGRTAYAVGYRSKDGKAALFVSKDGGKNFEVRVLDRVPDAFLQEPARSEAHRSRGPSSSVGLQALVPAEDGTVALVLRHGDGRLLVVADDDGRLLSRSEPPGDGARLAAVGSRAFAVDLAARQAFESLDAGVSWQPLGALPLPLCPEDASCDLPVACTLSGCVVGDELSRIGWNGQANAEAGVLGPGGAELSGFAERRTRTPLSCTLQPAAWRALPDAWAPPRADQSALGQAAWFSVTSDARKASAGLFVAEGGPRPKVTHRPLLPPVELADGYAFYVSNQIEGAAALRYRVPESTGRPRLADVEVAFANLLEGRTVRTVLGDGGPYRPGDYERRGASVQLARPDLLSIGVGGLYLRIHHADGSRQPTLFIDGRTIETVEPVDWPSTDGEVIREMAHVGTAHVPIGLLDQGSALLRARRAGGRWQFDAFTTGLREPKTFGLIQYRDIAYAGGRAGLHVMLHGLNDQGSALLFPFRADGDVTDPPIAVPTQRDAGDVPSACSAEQRASTPRVVVPFEAGTRHPILISDGAEPLRLLLSAKSVMYGTPRAPCTAAFEAEVVKFEGGGAAQGERALLFPDDLDNAWLFRIVADGQGSTQVEYRHMACRFDPQLEVPIEIYRELGTLVRRPR